jgi:iron complex transport system substrate-binding protein
MRETGPSTPSSSTRKGFFHAPVIGIFLALAILIGCQAGATSTPAVTRAPASSTSATVAPISTPSSTPTSQPTPTQAPTSAPTVAATASVVAAFPMTITDDEGTVTELDAEPQRVVSLTPATTELMFALDRGDKLVARGAFDDYPPEAAALPAVAEFTGVVIEDVVNLDPDLVLAGGNNFNSAEDISRLRDLGMPVIVLYADDLEGVQSDISLVAQAVGAETEADEINESIQARIDEVSTAVAGLDTPRTFYEIGYDSGVIYAPAPESFISDMIGIAGGESINTSDPTVFSMSREELVTADPQVIVLGDSAYPPPICPDSVADRSGWAGITAVTNGDVRPVNDVIVTRPGPRIGEGLAALALAIHPDAEVVAPEPGTDLCIAL